MLRYGLCDTLVQRIEGSHPGLRRIHAHEFGGSWHPDNNSMSRALSGFILRRLVHSPSSDEAKAPYRCESYKYNCPACARGNARFVTHYSKKCNHILPYFTKNMPSITEIDTHILDMFQRLWRIYDTFMNQRNILSLITLRIRNHRHFNSQARLLVDFRLWPMGQN